MIKRIYMKLRNYFIKFDIIRKIYTKIYTITQWIRRKLRFFLSKEYRMLKEYKGVSKIVLLDTPTHGNLGDQAIAYAENKFLEKECVGKIILEITQENYLYCKKNITKYLTKDDTIVIHGGGFIGTLWPNEEKIFLDILHRLSSYHLVVFPQTVYFEESSVGDSEKEKLKKTLCKCNKITVFLRDESSYKSMMELTDGMDVKCELVPDIVTYINVENCNIERKKRIILCMRKDLERTVEESQMQNVIDYFERENYEVVYTDTVVYEYIPPVIREKKVYNKWNEFLSASLVITDRLHGMVFAALTNTPCIAFDNISKKVSGCYKWIEYLSYIKCINISEFNIDIVSKLLKQDRCEYTNRPFNDYYKKLVDEILKRKDK